MTRSNSPRLPLAALGLAVLGGGAVVLTWPGAGTLSELQIGLVAWAFALAVFGLQGLLSVAVEGRELRPGSTPPRLTDPLSAAMAVLALLLCAAAVVLGVGISRNLPVQTIGTAAGLGCIALALLMLLYKEAFLGDEAAIEPREDGLPW
jgi:hypothetical protein